MTSDMTGAVKLPAPLPIVLLRVPRIPLYLELGVILIPRTVCALPRYGPIIAPKMLREQI